MMISDFIKKYMWFPIFLNYSQEKIEPVANDMVLTQLISDFLATEFFFLEKKNSLFILL